jgi:hypothetical protein
LIDCFCSQTLTLSQHLQMKERDLLLCSVHAPPSSLLPRNVVFSFFSANGRVGRLFAERINSVKRTENKKNTQSKMEGPTAGRGSAGRHRVVEGESNLSCGPLFAGGVDDAAVWSEAPFFLAGHTTLYSAASGSLFLFGGYDGRYLFCFIHFYYP